MAAFAFPATLDDSDWAIAAPILEGLTQPASLDDQRALWAVAGYALGHTASPDSPAVPPAPMAKKDAGALCRAMAGGKGHAHARTVDWGKWISLLQLILQTLGKVIPPAPSPAPAP